MTDKKLAEVQSLSVGSVFSGIGGIDLGLERAGMRVAWQIEKDDYCRGILARHWPDTPRHGDIHDVQPEELAPVDLVCGGVPCQPWSVAGERRGQEDGRDLWPAFWRLCRALRPRIILVEEVPGFVIPGGLGRSLSDLAEGGYDAAWGVVSASALGAPHIRRRLFIVAHAECPGLEEREGVGGDDGTERPPSQRGGGASPDGDEPRAGGEPPSHPDGGGRQRLGSGWVFDRERQTFRHHVDGCDHGPCACGSFWCAESPVCRVDARVPGRVAQLRALGNAVVPQVAEFIGHKIMELTP